MRSGNTMRAGVQIANFLMNEGHQMPEGARRTITFLVGEAYSYGPNVLVDLDQAIRVKADAALKLIIANVPVKGPKYTGTILNESQDLLVNDTTSDSRNGEFQNGKELQPELEDTGAELEKLRIRNQALEGEATILTRKLAEAQVTIEGLRQQLEAMVAKSTKKEGTPPAPLETPENDVNDEARVLLVTDEQVLDAIELTPLTVLLGDNNQHTRYKKICATADDEVRGHPFKDLKGIIGGIRDGTFDDWLAALQRDGLSRKSADTLKNFLVREEVFGDGNGQISIDKIRKALIPLLKKWGYHPVLSV